MWEVEVILVQSATSSWTERIVLLRCSWWNNFSLKLSTGGVLIYSSWIFPYIIYNPRLPNRCWDVAIFPVMRLQGASDFVGTHQPVFTSRRVSYISASCVASRLLPGSQGKSREQLIVTWWPWVHPSVQLVVASGFWSLNVDRRVKGIVEPLSSIKAGISSLQELHGPNHEMIQQSQRNLERAQQAHRPAGWRQWETTKDLPPRHSLASCASLCFFLFNG